MAHKLFVARTYAYVAAGKDGLAIIDIERAEKPKLYEMFNAEGAIVDARDVVVAHHECFAVRLRGRRQGGSESDPAHEPGVRSRGFYGFSPDPKPELIALVPDARSGAVLSRPLERDRAVDETGGQVAVFGRRGSRPFTAHGDAAALSR